MEHEQLTWSQAPADDLIIDMRGIYKRFYIGQPNELEILRGIDLQVKKGEFLSIVGASGSGKSTLMNIIGALDRPTEGTYTLDGVPMADVPDDMLSEIRNLKIGFVFQTFNLIPRTTALRNVELPMVYAGARRSPCTKRAKALLEIVGMGERMKHLPNELSGGQKQRISIARVFLKNPPVLILDEATSALDNESEHLVSQSLERLASGRTTLTIAHRLTTIRNADRILVLSGSNIIEEGNHEELIEKQGIYYQLYTSAGEAEQESKMEMKENSR